MEYRKQIIFKNQENYIIFSALLNNIKHKTGIDKEIIITEALKYYNLMFDEKGNKI